LSGIHRGGGKINRRTFLKGHLSFIGRGRKGGCVKELGGVENIKIGEGGSKGNSGRAVFFGARSSDHMGPWLGRRKLLIGNKGGREL